MGLENYNLKFDCGVSVESRGYSCLSGKSVLFGNFLAIESCMKFGYSTRWFGRCCGQFLTSYEAELW